MIGRDTFSALAPVLGPSQEKLVMSPSSTVHGGQYDTKYMVFEYTLRAAFVVDAACFLSLNQPVPCTYETYLFGRVNAHFSIIMLVLVSGR